MSEQTINNHQGRASKTRKNKEHNNLVIQNTVNWWLRSVRTWENPPQHISVIWGIRYLELPLCYINFSLSFNWFTWKMGTIVLPSSLPQRAKWIKKNKNVLKIITNIWNNLSILLPSSHNFANIQNITVHYNLSSFRRPCLTMTMTWLTRNSHGFSDFIKSDICLQINYKIHICFMS